MWNKHHAVRNRLFAVYQAHHKSSSRGSFYGFQHSMHISRTYMYTGITCLTRLTGRFCPLYAPRLSATCLLKSIYAYSKSCLTVRLMIYVKRINSTKSQFVDFHEHIKQRASKTDRVNNYFIKKLNFPI
jgi:hypothetical protein